MAEGNFIDYVKVFCRSGKGGAGSVHFRRDKLTSKGGPDGGDGGRGGHIIFKGNKQLWTLIHLKYRKHIHAFDGEKGGASQSSGAFGEDIVIEVPVGTVIKDSENQKKLIEITEDGQSEILLQGGRGGLGNVHFKNSVKQSPRYAQPGEDSKEGYFIIELKVLADAGLVGFPNAGKSTLLSVISAAKPEIADYAFTTLTPQLGVVQLDDTRSFILADIPGIIENAHKGKGLGIRFLRHIERNSVLLFTIPSETIEIKEAYELLVNELKMYNPELLDKKRILIITKTDLADEEIVFEMKKNLPEIPFVFVSSFNKTGLGELKELVWRTIND